MYDRDDDASLLEAHDHNQFFIILSDAILWPTKLLVFGYVDDHDSKGSLHYGKHVDGAIDVRKISMLMELQVAARSSKCIHQHHPSQGGWHQHIHEA